MSEIPKILAGTVAVVTGASRGIGKGIALELGAAGATVYVTGRTTTAGHLPGTVAGTAAEIDALGGTGVAVVCDHKDDSAVEKLFAQVREERGRLDVLVNNVYNSPPPPAGWAASSGRCRPRRGTRRSISAFDRIMWQAFSRRR